MVCYLKNSLLLLFVAFFISCGSDNENAPQTLIEKGSVNKSSEGAEVMRGLERILKLPLDSIYKPEKVIELRSLINAFKTCNLTDSTVRDEGFIKQLNHLDSLLVNASIISDTVAHNNLIKQCVNCHQSYCPGPITRIKKVYK